MDVKNPNVVFAAMWTVERKPWSIDSGSVEGGLYRTTDGGDHWTRLTNGLPHGAMVGKHRRVDVGGRSAASLCTRSRPATTRAACSAPMTAATTWTRIYDARNLQQRAFYYTHIYADPQRARHRLRAEHRHVQVDRRRQDIRRRRHPLARRQPRLVDQPDEQQDHHRVERRRRQHLARTAGHLVDAGQPADGRDLPHRDRHRWPYWVYGAQQDNSTHRGAEHQQRRDLRRRRRRERLHRGRPARRRTSSTRATTAATITRMDRARASPRTSASTPTRRPGSARPT